MDNIERAMPGTQSSQNDRKFFVEEWYIEQILGEGAFGEVRLLLNRKSKDQIAMKVIDLNEHPEAEEPVKKEAALHRKLLHENIIRFFGSRKDGQIYYIFLEYAAGGELFDQIEPDVGMDPIKAQQYFIQLLKAISYLHRNGICHRDIKPENILLDQNHKLKLSDFGFATLFRSKGVERLLDKRCGTLPYVAPEVLRKLYKAQPSDIWSCGIVLVALLAGELPWDRPQDDCEEYKNWKKGKATGHPWEKIEIQALNLLKRILNPQPSRRYTIEQIFEHAWLKRRSNGFKKMDNGSGSPQRKRMVSGANLPSCEDAVSRLCISQPQPCFNDNNLHLSDEEGGGGGGGGGGGPSNEFEGLLSPYFSFSQPAGVDDFFLGSQLASFPSSSSIAELPYQHWVQRLTRISVRTGKEESLKELTKVLSQMGYQTKVVHNDLFKGLTTVSVSTYDRRKNHLGFKISIRENVADRSIVLDFRRSKGDGLEFKRHFVRIREQLKDIEIKGPNSWSFGLGLGQLQNRPTSTKL